MRNRRISVLISSYSLPITKPVYFIQYHFYIICFGLFSLEMIKKTGFPLLLATPLKRPTSSASLLPPELHFPHTWEPRCRAHVFVILEVWLMNQQHQHHLGTCEKCRNSVLTTDPLNRNYPLTRSQMIHMHIKD